MFIALESQKINQLKHMKFRKWEIKGIKEVIFQGQCIDQKIELEAGNSESADRVHLQVRTITLFYFDLILNLSILGSRIVNPIMINDGF